ncbi:hypothetical protein C2845_PM07G25090 [Panicum miliaceum]|uniref:Uncharacterized protein n=1 Tax=Panicum miliaceum TaxID=4540 RepID=A0A3L6SHI7_PANMI|nr:hypothetical protein C2845_PM07G25090 [Panicum miliaceum]
MASCVRLRIRTCLAWRSPPWPVRVVARLRPASSGHGEGWCWICKARHGGTHSSGRCAGGGERELQLPHDGATRQRGGAEAPAAVPTQEPRNPRRRGGAGPELPARSAAAVRRSGGGAAGPVRGGGAQERVCRGQSSAACVQLRPAARVGASACVRAVDRGRARRATRGHLQLGAPAARGHRQLGAPAARGQRGA